MLLVMIVVAAVVARATVMRRRGPRLSLLVVGEKRRNAFSWNGAGGMDGDRTTGIWNLNK
jgi:hypothetical protein